MSKFLTTLKVESITDDIWRLIEPLEYDSDILGKIIVPARFYSDLASVPRIPIVFDLWGKRSHYEAVIHDYLYRIDSVPLATFEQANNVFYEAMRARGKSLEIAWPMFVGVSWGGLALFHKRHVKDILS